jgi:hypothetical protein
LDARKLKVTRKGIAGILQGRNASSDCSQVHSEIALHSSYIIVALNRLKEEENYKYQ